MGAFSDLMVEAKALGATDLRFTVNLNAYDGVADHVPRWSCHFGHLVECGRTGEEALRALVETLRHRSQPPPLYLVNKEES
jgi:hypothetical protein